MKIKISLGIICFLSVLVFSQVAIAETHSHSDDCYNGIKHVHSGSCYTSEYTYHPEGCSPVYEFCGGCVAVYIDGRLVWGCGGHIVGYECRGHSSSVLTCVKKEDRYYDGNENEVAPTCDRIVTSITATHPNQTVNQGDTIITTAIATYLDGHTGIVNCTSDFNTNKLGSQTVILTYSGLIGNAKTTGTRTCTVSVNVKVNLSHITVTVPQTMIYNGSTPQYNVKAHYFDGSTKSLSFSQYSILGWSGGVGKKTVTISYTEGTKTVTMDMEITVKPNVAFLYAFPSATTIFKGESVYFTVMVYYEDSTSRELLTGEYGQSSFEPNIVGAQTVSFNYTENARTVTTHVNILVLARLASITVETDRLEIYRGEESPQFTLTAFYESGSSKVISKGRYDAFNNNRIGIQTIPFSYTENGITKTASISIIVKPNLNHIIAYTENNIIFIGQDLGLDVTAIYEDNTNKLLTGSEYIISGFNNMLLGEQTVTVSYTENSITASKELNILVLEPDFDAYASAPIITPTSNSVGSKVLFSARTHNAEVVDILYSVDNSGYFSSTISELSLKEGSHTIKAKTVWRKLLETETQTTGYSILEYDLSVPGIKINTPSIDYNKSTSTVTITDKGATNTIIDRIEYSFGMLIDENYQFTNHVYVEPFTLSSLGDYIIRARVIDIDSNKSEETELHISIRVGVEAPVIKYNNNNKSFSLQNFECLNADYYNSYYRVNNGMWSAYNVGDNILLTDGEYIINAYNMAVRDGSYYSSIESSANITVSSISPTPVPGSDTPAEEGGLLSNSAFISLIAIIVFLFAWMIKQKLM